MKKEQAGRAIGQTLGAGCARRGMWQWTGEQPWGEPGVIRPGMPAMRITACLLFAFLLGGQPVAAQETFVEIKPLRATGIEGIDWYLGPAPNEITVIRTQQQVLAEVVVTHLPPEGLSSFKVRSGDAYIYGGDGGSLLFHLEACHHPSDLRFQACNTIDTTRADYALAAAAGQGNNHPVIRILDQLAPPVIECEDSVTSAATPDDGTTKYLATLALHLPLDACGNFYVHLDQGRSHLVGGDGSPVDYTYGTMRVTVPFGRCCGALVDGELACVEHVNKGECDAMAGVFDIAATCSGLDQTPADGIDDACSLCASDDDCNDGNACTVDSCQEHFCRSEDVTPNIFCCNPFTGDTVALSDGIDCTDDICTSDGSVFHVGAVVDGFCCHPDDGSLEPLDDENACTIDACLPDGSVTHEDTTPDGSCCNPQTGVLETIDDGNACTVDTCLADGSVLHEDDTPDVFCCSPSDGTLAEIDDADICTVDVCLPDGTVTHDDTTPDGSCCDPQTGTLKTIDDGNACTVDTCLADGSVSHEDATPPDRCCNPSNGILAPVDDGNACTDDVCRPDGTVTHEDVTPEGFCCDPSDGGLTAIDDGEACTIDICLSDGSVIHEDNSDGSFCCNPDDGSLEPIDDDNACTVDACLPDGSVTHDDTTPDGSCCDPQTGALAPVDDVNACTVDACQIDGTVTHEETTPDGFCCDPSNGALTQIEDADACTIDTCLPDGSVIHEESTDAGFCCNPADGALEMIDDDDVCTVDTCLPNGTVTHQPIDNCTTVGDFRVVPVRAAGVEGVDWELGPGAHEITLHRADQLVEFEIHVRPPTAYITAAYQASISCAPFIADPWEALAVGGVVCPAEGAFGTEFCRGVDTERMDYVFAGVSSFPGVLEPIITCDAESEYAYSGGAVSLDPANIVGDGSWYYGLTGTIDVRSHARGSYQVELEQDGLHTFIDDAEANQLPIGDLIPATITVTSGECVVDDSCSCSTLLDCQDMGGAFAEDAANCNQDTGADGGPNVCLPLIEIRPVRASGIEGIDWFFGPGTNEITLVRGGQQIMADVLLSRLYESGIDFFTVNVNAGLFVQGDAGEVLLVQALCDEPDEANYIFCQALEPTRSDYVFAEPFADGLTSPITQFDSCGLAVPPCAVFSDFVIVSNVGPFGQGDSDIYLASLAIEASAMARGVFTVPVDPDRTFISASAENEFFAYSAKPLRVVVAEGRCCGANLGGVFTCLDGISAVACESMGGGFEVGGVCIGEDINPQDGIDDACSVCSFDTDCDDGNECTVDTCLDSFCMHLDMTPGGQCCDPATGKVVPRDDGNACTVDLCLSDGSVYHDVSTPSGFCCNPNNGELVEIDDGDGCTIDVCQNDGQVTHDLIDNCSETGKFRVIPVRASGVEGVDWESGPGETEITLHRAGQLVSLEVEVQTSSVDITPAWQGSLACDPFLTDTWNALHAVELLCPVEGDFDTDFCRGVDSNRDDYIFAGLPSLGSVTPALGCEDAEPELGLYISGGAITLQNGVQGDGEWHYGFTAAVEVDSHALGTYQFNFVDDQDKTFQKDQFATDIPISELISATVTITSGRCVIGNECTCTSMLDCQDMGGDFTVDPDGCGQDSDGDGNGDACDADMDGDGVSNAFDMCNHTPGGMHVTEQGTHRSDVNQDCAVDLNDYAAFVACLSVGGPGHVPAAGHDTGSEPIPGFDGACLPPFDLEDDNDIDLADAATLFREFGADPVP